MITVDVDFGGVLKRIMNNSLKTKVNQVSSKATFEVGNAIRNSIIRNIQTSPKSGNVYLYSFRVINGRTVPIARRSTPHKASAPGEYPSTDTGNLVRNIQLNTSKNGFNYSATIESRASYSAFLEYGHRTVEGDWVAPRPFMEPGFNAARAEIKMIIDDIPSQIFRGI